MRQELGNEIKKRILKVVEDALEDDGQEAVRFSLRLAQKYIDKDDAPVFGSYNSEGATVGISVFPHDEDWDDCFLESLPQNVADVFWYDEADCWRSQANMILALEGSLNAMKAKFEECFGFPVERDVLIKKAQQDFPKDQYPLGPHTFWPDNKGGE